MTTMMMNTGVKPDHAKRPVADRPRWKTSMKPAVPVAVTPIATAAIQTDALVNPCRPPIQDLSASTHSPVLGSHLSGLQKREKSLRDFTRAVQDLGQLRALQKRD